MNNNWCYVVSLLLLLFVFDLCECHVKKCWHASVVGVQKCWPARRKKWKEKQSTWKVYILRFVFFSPAMQERSELGSSFEVKAPHGRRYNINVRANGIKNRRNISCTAKEPCHRKVMTRRKSSSGKYKKWNNTKIYLVCGTDPDINCCVDAHRGKSTHRDAVGHSIVRHNTYRKDNNKWNEQLFILFDHCWGGGHSFLQSLEDLEFCLLIARSE